MREIKFKAWSKDLKVMLDIQKMSFRFKRLLPYGWNVEHNSNSFELMQFTGLYDKNDNEIYEGDIVRTKDYGGGAIIYGGIQPTKLNIVEFSEKWGGYHFDGIGFRFDKECIEVIGNIYENPELLK